ncbi:hypothetical protein AMAG_07035, partial [Allomyces macrogynus ATCC 38327]
MRALPLTQLRHSQIDIDVYVADESNADPDADVARLAAAMPTCVESLQFAFKTCGDVHEETDLLTLTQGLPFATRALNIAYNLPRYAEHFHLFRFTPTIESLRIDGLTIPAYDDRLAQFLARMPAPLTHLELYDLLLGETDAIKSLAKAITPQLTTLLLPINNLTHADLDQLALRWPVTLHELSLRFNVNVRYRGHPKEPVDLAERVQDTERRAWIEALPANLRVLDLYAVPISDGMVVGLVERMPMRAPMARMVLYLKCKWVSNAAIALLETNVFV